MFRRTLIKALTVAAGSAALTACSTEDDSAAQSTDNATNPSARPSGAGGGKPPAGTLAVSVSDLALSRGERKLDTKLWAPRDGGPYPLILFSHGLTAHPDDWKGTLSRWAQAGFVVAAPAYPHTHTDAPDYDDADVPNQPADAQAVITAVLKELGGKVNPKKIGAAGHSAGGITTIGLLSKVRDKRISAGIVMAGRQDFGFKPYSGEATVLFVQGEKDKSVTPAQAKAAYDAAPWKKAYLSFPASGHLVDGPAAEVVIKTSVDFWRWTLYDDVAAMKRLPEDALKDGLAKWTSSFD